MDVPREYHTKWKKPDRERQISYNITYMWNLKKMTQINLHQNRNRLTDWENKCIPKGKGSGEGQIRTLGLTCTRYSI